MKYLRLLPLLLFSTFYILNSSFALAQVSPSSVTTPSSLAKGVPPLGSYDGGSFDTVNLYNGNLSMRFPLGALSGRGGMTAAVVLSYNAKLWRAEQKRRPALQGNPPGTELDPVSIPVFRDWDTGVPMIAPGWLLHAGRLSARQSGWNDIPVACNLPNATFPRYIWTLTTITFTAPDGTEYEFRDTVANGAPLLVNGCEGLSRGATWVSTDGTAATFYSHDDNGNPVEIRDRASKLGAGSVQPFLNGTVVLRDGTRFTINQNRVVKQQDRNGNVIRYEYKLNSSILTRIVDTLGREIKIDYNVPVPGKDLLLRVTLPGKTGATTDRTIDVEKDRLRDLLVANESIKTIGQLFPESQFFQTPEEFNPGQMPAAITLPSGHKWLFRYNAYGEIAQVTTPSGGKVEYVMGTEAQSPGPVYNFDPQIFRVVKERRVYPDGQALEGKTTYHAKRMDGDRHQVTEVHEGAANERLQVVRHRFKTAPLDPPLIGGASSTRPPQLGFKTWREAKEIETTVLPPTTSNFDVETGFLQQTRYTFEQRETVAWSQAQMWRNPANPDSQPANDVRLVKTEMEWENGQKSETRMTYDQYNNVVDETVFDYDGKKLRRVNRSYVTTLGGSNYATNKTIHLRSLPSQEAIYGYDPVTQAESLESRTVYTYDQYSGEAGGLVGRTFAPTSVHNTNPYGTSWTTRGNVTKVEVFGQTGSKLSDSFSQYDIAGNVVKTFGPANAAGQRRETIIGYTGGLFNHAYPNATSVMVNGVNLATATTYDFNTGLVLTETGNNGETTTYDYVDALDRLTRVNRPAGMGFTTYGYSAAGTYPVSVTSSVAIDGSQSLTATSFFDGMLKPIRSERDDPTGMVFSETEYDGMARPRLVSNPYRTTTDETYGWTGSDYDGLSRVVRVTTASDKSLSQSTGTVMSSYSGPVVLVEDQAGKRRQSRSDALGRVREVIEDPGGLGYVTSYKYDGRGNLREVKQSGGRNEEQTRTFIYDGMSRLLEATVPESGRTTYQYDPASNLTVRTDARQVQTLYTYDILGRLLVKSYIVTGDVAPTPTVRYFYDQFSTIPAADRPAELQDTTANKGRMIGTATDGAPTDRQGMFYEYETNGRVTRSLQWLDGVAYPMSVAGYNLASQPTGMTYPSGTQIGMAYNEVGQTTQVTRNGATFAGEVQYSAAGAVVKQQLGNGLFHAMTYNSRLQPTEIKLGTTESTADMWEMEYSYGVYDTGSGGVDSSRNNGNIGTIRMTPGADRTPITQAFEYDQLNRLTWAQETYIPQGVELTGITPAEGVQGTTIQVQLAGENLADIESLVFTPATGITVSDLSSTETTVTATLTLAADAPTTVRAVRAVTPLGMSNPVAFTVQAPPGPHLTTVTPDEAERGAFFVMQLAGTNLAGAMDVVFTPADGILISNLSSTATLATVTVEIDPDVNPGERQVQVMTPAGLSNALPFTILAPAAPVIDELIPATARQGDTFTLVINGSRLAGTSALNFDSEQGLAISNLASTETQVMATVTIQLDALPGVRQVSVTTAAGVSNQLPFTVVPLNLVLTSLTPDAPFQGEVFTLELTGTDLQTVTNVEFTPADDISVSNVTATGTTVTATVGVGSNAVGNRQVTVTNGFSVSNALVLFLPDACALSGVVVSESGDMYGGEPPSGTSRAHLGFQPNLPGSGATNAQTLDWRGDVDHSGNVVIDLDLTQVDGEAQLEVTLLAGLSWDSALPVAAGTEATINGALNYPGGSADVSLGATFGADGRITAIDGVPLPSPGGTSTTRPVISQFTVMGGGHVQLVYTATAGCTPATAAIQQNFYGEIALLTCRAVPPPPIPNPIITSVTPGSGKQGTTVQLRIEGQNLSDALAIAFAPGENILVTNLVSAATEVTADVEFLPNAPTGAVQVQVSTPVGVSNSLPFTIRPTPQISSISPNGIELLNSPEMPFTFDLTISGTGLETAGAVTFSTPDFAAAGVDASPTQVTTRVTVAAGAPFGTRELWVETTYGVTSSVPFEFRQLVPRSHRQKTKTRKPGDTGIPDQPSETRGLQVQPPDEEISWEQTWSYDRFGNRKTAVTRIGETENRQDLVVNGRNNRVNETAGMSYDAAGNVISDNGKSFKYDAENRMVEAIVNNVTTRYRYDGEGRRIKKTVGTAVTRFVYGMGGELIAEHEGLTASPSTPTKEYVYGPMGMLAEVTGSEVNYLTPDHLGSPRVLTSQNGIVVNRRDFFPFGEDIAVGVGGRSAGMGYGTDSLRHRFTGKERDQETGLDFFGARYYGNSIGRFTGVDTAPIRRSHLLNPQDLNRYSYVTNNPLRYFDPDGKEKIKIEIKTFIPQKSVGGYDGDNRNIGEAGTSRTKQTIEIETDPSKRPRPSSKNSSKALGSLKSAATPLPFPATVGPETDSSRETGNSRNTITGSTGKASGETLLQYAKDSGNKVIVNAQGNEQNPLVPGSPGITFNFTLQITSTGAQNPLEIVITGDHDAFPGYEIIVTRPEAENNQPTVIYGFDPREGDTTPISLFPPTDVTVNKTETIPATKPNK